MRMQILGIDFFKGSEQAAVDRMWEGGLVVAPSGPGLAEDLLERAAYREALRSANLVIPDSGAMVLVWNLIRAGNSTARLSRVSGLAFLRAVFADDRVRTRKTFWVMPSQEEAEVNLAWLCDNGLQNLRPDDTYIAPDYRRTVSADGTVTDPALVSAIERQRPDLIVLNVGGGIQEPLGAWLASQLSYRPAILCTGAALAFLTGRQAAIPPWADRFYLGWLLRTLKNPIRFGSRYLRALPLPYLIARYGSALPPMRNSAR